MMRVLLAAVAAASLSVAAHSADDHDHEHGHGTQAAHAHQHGHVSLDVAVEGGTLTLAMSSPLDSIVGYERAPRTEAERRAAAQALARLRAPGALFVPDAAAGCKLAQATVEAPVLEGDGKGGGAGDGHADLDADYEFECAKPEALRTLKLGLFDTFARIKEIVVQTATPAGQTRVELQRPANTVKLGR